MNANPTTDLLVSILFFPSFFQGQVMEFVWGATDPTWIMAAKRLFLLLPTSAALLGLWASIFCILSVVVRQNRKDYVTAVLLTWWDLGRSTLTFWGGTFLFTYTLVLALFELVKVIVAGVWIVVQDVLLIPFRLAKSVASNVLSPGIPWIAVMLTLFWCLVEATIFTYVMTPLVSDTLANLSGETLSQAVIRIPLYLFMLFLILGSYAVLSTWTEALKTKDVSAIVKIGVIEFVAMVVEVLFLYREFVDSLVPWFAQYSSGFELGIGGTLGIAFLVWSGIRGMSWFLFAAHGTPTIMAIIQGAGVRSQAPWQPPTPKDSFTFTVRFFNQMKSESAFLQQKGEGLVSAFVLPPLQVIAAALNFCTLLIAARHVFSLPFKSLSDVAETRDLLSKKKKRASKSKKDDAA